MFTAIKSFPFFNLSRPLRKQTNEMNWTSLLTRTADKLPCNKLLRHLQTANNKTIELIFNVREKVNYVDLMDNRRSAYICIRPIYEFQVYSYVNIYLSKCV